LATGNYFAAIVETSEWNTFSPGHHADDVASLIADAGNVL
jgi:hypothetical protein